MASFSIKFYTFNYQELPIDVSNVIFVVEFILGELLGEKLEQARM